MNVCEIRAAVAADAAAVAEIYSHYVHNTTVTFEFDAPDAAEMQRRMEDIRKQGFPCLVAEQEGRVVGFAWAKQFRRGRRTALRWRTRSTWTGSGRGGEWGGSC